MIKYPNKVKLNIKSNRYFPQEFRDFDGDGDQGFITPLGTIMHCTDLTHHDAIKDILTDEYINALSKVVSSRTYDDIIYNEDDSVLVADALDHGFIRFSATEDVFLEFGNKITSKSLYVLYDFVDWIMKSKDNIEDDAKGKFKCHVEFNGGLDANGSPKCSSSYKTYTSLDDVDLKLINDVKKNVQIISG